LRKRSVNVALTDLVSPQLYLDAEAPSYRTGIFGVLSMSCISVGTAAGLYLYMRSENKRRDRLAETDPSADPDEPESASQDPDRTDRQDLRFRYML
jgi:hypothetical protein